MDAAGEIHEPVSVEARPGLLVFPDAQSVARAAALRWVELARDFMTKEGGFYVALAGGSTPRELYQLLASDEFRPQVDWSKVHVFWGDERAVPPDHAESNYGMARRELLSRVPVPQENIHRMEAEQADLSRAAKGYEDILRHHLRLDARGFPRFHLILLGLGADGHTASLFPQSLALGNTRDWVSAPSAKKLGSRRMTLTLPVLSAAHHVLFLVTGAAKASVLQRVLEGSADPPLPAQLVRPVDGERIFFVDKAAAGELLGATGSKKSPSQTG